MPILNTDSSSSSSKKSAPASDDTRESKTQGVPALPFLERIEAWLDDAGPREQLFAVALNVMLDKKDTIKKITGREVYKDMISKYEDTVCRIAGGSENLDKADDEDEAMAAALAALVAFS